MQQKDHIILPKATLKRFADEKNNKIAYLALRNKEIKLEEQFPRAFHTSGNYYNPEYDEIIKRYETLLGKLHKKIKDAIDTEFRIFMSSSELKKDIIELITLQFNRSVLADDALLGKYREQEQYRYNTISAELFRTGNISREFIERKKAFEKNAESDSSFRYYAQNIIGQENEKIKEYFEKFEPFILSIPNDVASTFILPPQHFLSGTNFARFVLSPRIALALFPQQMQTTYFKKLTAEEVDFMFPRVIESAMCMEEKYREVIGEKNYLIHIRDILYKYRESFFYMEDEQILIVCGREKQLKDDQTILEMISSIMVFAPQCKKIILEENVLSEELLKNEDLNKELLIFVEREYEVALISDDYCKNLEPRVKRFESKEQAITFFKKEN